VIERILRMNAAQREDIDVAYAGDIARPASQETTPVTTALRSPAPDRVERMVFPTPVISVAIEQEENGRHARQGAQPLFADDPNVHVHTTSTPAQTIIAGLGCVATSRCGRNR